MSRKRLPKLPPIEEIREGTYLWSANDKTKQNANITKYMNWLREEKQLDFKNYEQLWQWSVEEMEDFWQSIYEYFPFDHEEPYESVMSTKQMPKTKWFEGAHANYAEHILKDADLSRIAVYSKSETRTDVVKTWKELTNDVLKLATYLREHGIRKGDRVAGYLPNIYEAVVSLLATASVGAIWTSVSPDFGLESAMARFGQVKPKLIIAVGGYTYKGIQYDRREEVRQMKAQLPSVEGVIFVPYVFAAPKNDYIHLWPEIMNTPPIALEDFQFEQMKFNDQLWILYSSGTTGKPKGMVHTHGGILLEMYKANAFHLDLTYRDTMFFYTTTGWMMFNLLTSSLLMKGAIVLYDGHAAYPDEMKIWDMVHQTRTTVFGSSPAYIQLMRKQNQKPNETYDFGKLKTIVLSGSPASPEVYHWLYDNVKRDMWVTSQSGGTDICSAFVGAIPTEPVRAGEIQVRALGAAVFAFDEMGRRVYDEIGELVVVNPMPSMPLYLWDDPTGARYEASYFSVYPKVWRHGDFIEIIKDTGSIIMHGRSDSTLNRGGVRIGTSEIYHAVEANPLIEDSLVVHVDIGDVKSYMPLFIKLKGGAQWTDAATDILKERIQEQYTARHVPDMVYVVNDIPYTLTDKKMEVPVRRILSGEALEEVANREAMRNPDALYPYVEFYETVIKPMKG